MLLGFDHVILTVEDIDCAVHDFEALGFHVTRRDDADPAPFRNRLICLRDGSYIELVVFDEPSYAATHRFRPLLEEGPGWAEAVVWTDSIEADAARIAAAGLPFLGPREIEKSLVDGRRWSLSVLVPGRGYGHPALPMLAQDTAEHTLRVPDRLVDHPSGVTGVAGVVLVVEDAQAAGEQVGAVLGVDGADIAPPDGAAAAKRFSFAGRHVDVVSPLAGSEFARHLDTRGEGLFEVRLSGGAPGLLQHAGGARLSLGV